MKETNKVNKHYLKKVFGGNGGFFRNEEQERDYYNDIHYGCGGHIKNHGKIFKDCVCEKCGVSHYWYDDFFDLIPSGEGPYF